MALKLIPSRPTSSRERTRARTSRFSLPNLRTTSSSETIPRVNSGAHEDGGEHREQESARRRRPRDGRARLRTARTSASTMSIPSTPRSLGRRAEHRGVAGDGVHPEGLVLGVLLFHQGDASAIARRATGKSDGSNGEPKWESHQPRLPGLHETPVGEHVAVDDKQRRVRIRRRREGVDEVDQRSPRSPGCGSGHRRGIGSRPSPPRRWRRPRECRERAARAAAGRRPHPPAPRRCGPGRSPCSAARRTCCAAGS